MQGEHLKEYKAFGLAPFLANSLAGAIAEKRGWCDVVVAS